jgi:BirA family transcriptional regulator, biotin operon repressor / biotin---[acetyl-CoA-carboxylase] ligase
MPIANGQLPIERPRSRKSNRQLAIGNRQSSFDLARLRANIKPFRLYWFSRLRSTNDHAGRLRRTGKLFAPAIVLTGKQIAGRGRGVNKWWSDSGVLTVTFAFPIQERLAPQELPLIAGLALRNAAAEITGEADIQLKWPNDLLFEDRKLAGLLCERVSNVDLVGIGLNVNVDPAKAPKSLQNTLTSLLCIGGKTYDVTDCLIAIARHLHREVRRRMEVPFSTFVREYSRHDGLVGKTATVVIGDEPPVTGRCEGVDNSGRLVVRQRGKAVAVVAGMVTIHSRGA